MTPGRRITVSLLHITPVLLDNKHSQPFWVSFTPTRSEQVILLNPVCVRLLDPLVLTFSLS